VHKQVIVIDVSERRDSLVVLINPEILDTSGVSDIEEGCLSVPAIYETLERAERVKVRACDQNGNPFTLEAQGCWRSASSTRWITWSARCSSRACPS
jgi:peptide deformylase